jgi:hypothetical protein
MKIRKIQFLLFSLLAVGMVYVVQDYSYHQRIEEDEKLIKTLLMEASIASENVSSYSYHDFQIRDAVGFIDTAKVRLLEYYSLRERPSDYNELGMFCFYVEGGCGVHVPYELMKVYQKYGDEAAFLGEMGLQYHDSQSANWFEYEIRNKSIPEIVLLLNNIKNQLVVLDKKNISTL